MTEISLQIYNNFLKNFLIENFSIGNTQFVNISKHTNFFEMPKNDQHGDLSTNVAMMYAKKLGINPREFAQQIISALNDNKEKLFIKKIDIAGPGFINLYLDPVFWQLSLKEILKNIKDFGYENIGHDESVNIEYVSANPTGPLHIGHCRGAVIGDVLASLYDRMGYKVTREYYVNDAGGQINQLIASIKYKIKSHLSINIEEDVLTYNGEYIEIIAEEIVQKYTGSIIEDPNCDEIIRKHSIDHILNLIKKDLQKINIKHDLFYSEKSLLDSGEIPDAIEILKQKGFVYWGKLDQPINQENIDVVDREQELFKSTDFGDDIDRAISKADGTHTYFASDIAYHNNKIKRGFTKLINIWGADHAGYVARLRGAVNALTANTSTVEIILCQLVKLFRDNKPVKMSKRNNDYITIDEVVDEVGPDPIRFMMLFRKADAPLDFDFVKVCDKSKENPVFYVQYAHARIHSVFRNWNEANDKKFHDVISNFESNFDRLIDTNEINIIKNMCYYPMVIRNALDTNDIHKIAYYLHELASEFHSLWNHGNDNSEKRFIIENQELTEQRLCLIYCVAGVIKSGMDILGVSCPESM